MNSIQRQNENEPQWIRESSPESMNPLSRKAMKLLCYPLLLIVPCLGDGIIKDTLKRLFSVILTPQQYQELKKFYWSLHTKDFAALKDEFKKKADGEGWPDHGKVSILCCCFNARYDVLKEMLDSCLWQTYQNWELCLLNSSDASHYEIGELISSYAARDSRIKVVTSANRGIGLNSRYISRYATGEYILLLDHDDMLSPIAISKLLREAVERHSDFVYADEYILYPTGYTIRKKDDFDLKKLWKDNYLNHPGFIRKSLFDEVGGFRGGFDGSQDYDLYLRLAENTKNIYHVREPLYVWRITEYSFSHSSLPVCIDSGKRALEEHLMRTGIKARVTAERYSARFQVKEIRDE